jgi:hypothetical protein
MQTHCYRSLAFGFDADAESNEVRGFVGKDAGLGWLIGIHIQCHWPDFYSR